jgi:hypothetical protein
MRNKCASRIYRRRLRRLKKFFAEKSPPDAGFFNAATIHPPSACVYRENTRRRRVLKLAKPGSSLLRIRLRQFSLDIDVFHVVGAENELFLFDFLPLERFGLDPFEQRLGLDPGRDVG